MFATSVPDGSCGKVEFSRFARYQRRSAPSEAPIAMATMEITMDWFPLDLECPREELMVSVTPEFSSPALILPFGSWRRTEPR